MNFYTELEDNAKLAGIGGRKTSVPDELKPTPKDFAELDYAVDKALDDTYTMRELSERYASESMPAGSRFDRITMTVESLIGNFIVAKNGKCITYRQFYEFYEAVTSKGRMMCLVDRTYPLEDYFDDFDKHYSFLVIKSGNVIFPVADRKIIGRHFRIGLPKGLVSIFDELAASIEYTEEDIAECKKACSSCSKKIELRKNK